MVVLVAATVLLLYILIQPTQPNSKVYSDFQSYALSTLDRSYIPLSVKDYVRSYFSSLDPSN